MSALSRINGHRAPSPSVIGYDELRDKVAALVRPDKPTASNAQAPQPRSSSPAAASPGPVKADRLEAPILDLNNAFDILGRAKTCFDLLTHRLNHVEGERDDALAQIEDHKRAVASWQEMIETVQARMRDAERDLASMRQEIASQKDRADAAERHAVDLEGVIAARDRRMGELEQSYTSLHQEVMSSFGYDSTTYRTIETLVERFSARAA